MTVKQVQHLLGYLGYDPGIPDGVPGQKTMGAIKEFQTEQGLTADGKPGELTCERLLEAVKAGTEKNGDFWAEIRYFRREEFRCKCGGRYCNGWPEEPKEQMVRMADAIREHFGRPAMVISGLRCEKWNALQGGVANSQHMFGEACDIAVAGTGWEQVLGFVKMLPGLRYAYHIEGSNNVHFDIPAGER